VLDGDLDRVAISLPPGHAKSDTVTRRLPIYFGETRSKPDAVVLTGYSQTFASKNLSKPARELAKEKGILSPESTALDEWEFTSGVRLIARGVGAAPTGINPIALLIIDDPIKDRAQAESKVERDNIKDWYTGSIVQRFREGTKVFVIQTRWHEYDLIGHLKATQPDQWTFINLPAIAEEDDPLGRAPGEALWPEVHSLEHLERIRKEMGEREFQALYQGNPTPREGSMFQVSKLGIVDVIPSGLNSCMGVDLAAGENEGDWTAAPIVYGPDADGIYYVDPWRIRKEPAERNRQLRQRADLKNPRTIRIPQDPGAAGKESVKTLISVFAGHSIKSAPVSGSKELRAEPGAAQVNAGNVRVLRNEHTADFIEEFRAFPNGKHDDFVDGFSDAFAQLTVRTWNLEIIS